MKQFQSQGPAINSNLSLNHGNEPGNIKKRTLNPSNPGRQQCNLVAIVRRGAGIE